MQSEPGPQDIIAPHGIISHPFNFMPDFLSSPSCLQTVPWSLHPINSATLPVPLCTTMNFAPPLTIKGHIPDVYNNHLTGQLHVFEGHSINGSQEKVALCLPSINNHIAFQYVQPWDKLHQAITSNVQPFPHNILIYLWYQLCHGYQFCRTPMIWQPLLCNYGDMPIPTLFKVFFSLVHCFGYDSNVPSTFAPNQI